MTREESIALLDPELSDLIARPSENLEETPLDVARANALLAIQSLHGLAHHPPEIVRIPNLTKSGDLEIRVHHPGQQAPKLAVLHVHGGGMVKGSAAAFDARTSALANQLGAIVASVSYRLAPETSFPGPMQDCVAAWMWLVNQSAIWGLNPKQCIITGDSSGGGLAAASTLYLRDTSGPMPAGQVLVYPMLEYKTGLEPDAMLDTRLGWNSINNQFGWRALLGTHDVPTGQALGHFSPTHAVDFQGLPPTWIGVGTLDLFLDECLAFAHQLAKANVSVDVCVYRGAPHGFPSIQSEVSRRFYRDYINAFHEMIGLK